MMHDFSQRNRITFNNNNSNKITTVPPQMYMVLDVINVGVANYSKLTYELSPGP